MFEIDDNSDKMNRILTPSLMSLFFIFRSVYVRFEWYLVNYSSSGNNFGSKWKEIKTKFFGGAIHKGRPQIFANFWHPWSASSLVIRFPNLANPFSYFLVLPSLDFRIVCNLTFTQSLALRKYLTEFLGLDVKIFEIWIQQPNLCHDSVCVASFSIYIYL